ncbi:hypothetical protein ACPRNU_23985, partial [Chromobacterium vaccinii]|uniref:hypothetical protein n=1 Tax=Chromobacterium vaccinii TaxID=1108595 RepID=UPI003C712CF0
MPSLNMADFVRAVNVNLQNQKNAQAAPPAPDPNITRAVAAIQASVLSNQQMPSVIVKLSAQAAAAAAASNPPAQAEHVTYAPSMAAGFAAAAQTPLPGMPAGYTLGSALAGSAGAFVGTAAATACEVATGGAGGVACVAAGIAAGEATGQSVNNMLAHI